ncbi:MAG: efflux RND transporter periplasmic adaptor subunit [Verrucomicrobiales bacterium]|nr:efflux RND transporter periplasmic adaptor subunit [Verrucomicrobiales bacterium]
MPLPKSKSQIELERLWRFEGPESDFWGEVMRVYCRQIEAASGMVLVQAPDPEGNLRWTPFSVWPNAEETRQRLAGHRESLFELASDASKAPGVLSVSGLNEGIRGAALPLRLEDETGQCVAVFLRYGSEDFFHPSDRMIRLMADTPLIYGADLSMGKESSGISHNHEEEPMATAVTLSLLLNDENRFLASAMLLCNELAARYSADRVSLGWEKGSYVRLRATNHAEKIDRKMEVSQLLAAAMEECLDQNDEIVWPGGDTSRSIERDHESYARKAGVKNLASIPLRKGDEPIAAVTLERVEPFTESDLNSLRLTCDLVVRRLDDLRQRDRWFGARLASGVHRAFAKVFGVEHTWIKVGALTALGLLAFLIFYPWPYRVEAGFVLQPEEVYHLPAPFEGYIEKVNVRTGDAVKRGDLLVEMNTAELRLHAAELAATVQRYLAEAQLARSEATPAEMHIAISKAEESKSELKKVQFNLGISSVTAPIDSFVIEGDLRERIGSPVSRGEALLKLSKLDGMFAELRVLERDVLRVAPGSSGEAAFASRPDLKFPIEVTEIEPIAVAEEAGNMLIVRTAFRGEAGDWWRPGMTGVVKIDCGERSLLWIFTHRAIDYLRMKFWF